MKKLNEMIASLNIELKKSELRLCQKEEEITMLKNTYSAQTVELQRARSQISEGRIAMDRDNNFGTPTKETHVQSARLPGANKEVKTSSASFQEQDPKSLRAELDELQQKLIVLEDDKLMAEMKMQEQEIHIQEQFEIIQDYSTEIEEHNIRE